MNASENQLLRNMAYVLFVLLYKHALGSNIYRSKEQCSNHNFFQLTKKFQLGYFQDPLLRKTDYFAETSAVFGVEKR